MRYDVGLRLSDFDPDSPEKIRGISTGNKIDFSLHVGRWKANKNRLSVEIGGAGFTCVGCIRITIKWIQVIKPNKSSAAENKTGCNVVIRRAYNQICPDKGCDTADIHGLIGLPPVIVINGGVGKERVGTVEGPDAENGIHCDRTASNVHIRTDNLQQTSRSYS